MTPYDNPEYKALRAAADAAPKDRTPRLVLADWLEEAGETDSAILLQAVAEIEELEEGSTGKLPLKDFFCNRVERDVFYLFASINEITLRLNPGYIRLMEKGWPRLGELACVCPIEGRVEGVWKLDAVNQSPADRTMQFRFVPIIKEQEPKVSRWAELMNLKRKLTQISEWSNPSANSLSFVRSLQQRAGRPEPRPHLIAEFRALATRRRELLRYNLQETEETFGLRERMEELRMRMTPEEFHTVQSQPYQLVEEIANGFGMTVDYTYR